MNSGGTTYESGRRLPDTFDLGAWELEAAKIPHDELLLVPLPSHVPELFHALIDRPNTFDATIQWIVHQLESGQRLALLHQLTPATLREAPDLVRFVDDRFRSTAGIRFELHTELNEGDLPGIRPWWQATRVALDEREMGWEPPHATWWPASNSPGLTPPALKERYPAAPEDCVVMATGPTGTSLPVAVETILTKLGGMERFVHPARLTLPPELLARYCADEPRDNERVHRSVRDEPWVLLKLGLAPHGKVEECPSLPLLEEVMAHAHRVGTRPFLAIRTPQNSELETHYLPSLRALCARYESRLMVLYTEEQAESIGEESVERLSFDFVVHVGRSTDCGDGFMGAVKGMWGLLPPDSQAQLYDALLASTALDAAEEECRPLSAWHRDLVTDVIPDTSWLRTGDNIELEEAQLATADFWLQEVSSPSMILGSTDPYPLDRFLVDTLGHDTKTIPHLNSAIERGYIYALHRGVRISGDTPPDRVIGSSRPSLHRSTNKPLRILGLASTTLQNHAATLLEDGRIVAAVQEERIRRRKQIGWHPNEKPNATVVSDGTIPLERAYPWRAIGKVLAEGGIAFEDVDIIALNGIPSRFFDTYSLKDPKRPPQTICHENFVFVPHHLTHAASAYRVSGFEDAFVFTVDGRGERETAAFFEAKDGHIERIFDVLCHEDSLIGGVYEFITTILGFGHHGQGSTMGLAPMGNPTIDMSHFLSAKTRADYSIHDRGIMEAFGHLVRDRNGPLDQVHMDLAASVQQALEETVIRFIEDGLQGRNCDYLCLAGGVALNCSMNQRLRTHFGLKEMFVQPAAHDAGTSLGAALEAHWLITGEPVPTTMNNAYFGPSYPRTEIVQTLESYGIPYTEPEALEDEVAQLLADGSIVCRFNGRAEFGPRALGARSILADPRQASMKARLNTLKRRQWWRPFGPSILAGHETDYFENAHISPFMLFTLPVRTEKQGTIPAVLHVDGTTRPQSVTKEANPSYHQLIQRFYEITGVPMVVNTSFNTAFEPIVETPGDAVSTFLQVGADYLAIDSFLVSRRDIENLT